jgi:hypothetical protein
MKIFSRMSVPPDVAMLERKKNEKGLINALKYKDDDAIRAASAKALSNIGTSISVPQLTTALQDENCNVRANAAEALGAIGCRMHIDVGFKKAYESIGNESFRTTLWMFLKVFEMAGYPQETFKALFMAALNKNETDMVKDKAIDVLIKLGIVLEEKDIEINYRQYMCDK